MVIMSIMSFKFPGIPTLRHLFGVTYYTHFLAQKAPKIPSLWGIAPSDPRASA